MDTAGGRSLVAGAIAGATSALAFTALHQLIISDIWFSLVPMLVAGAVCGACLAWSYGCMFARPSASTWWRYNLAYVALLALLALLGLTSIALFEPVTTIPQLLTDARPPVQLFRKTVPLTVGFVVGSAILLWTLWGRTIVDAVAVLVTCAVVVLGLGLNVSIMGLVRLTSGTAYLVAEQFGLTLFLGTVYAAAFVIIQRPSVAMQRSPPAASPDSR